MNLTSPFCIKTPCLPAGGAGTVTKDGVVSTRCWSLAMAVITGDKIDIQIGSCVQTGLFRCTVLPIGSEIMLHVPNQYTKFLTDASSATLIEFDVVLRESAIHVTIDPRKGGRVLIHPGVTRGPIQTAELFGGISGWSYAAKHFGIRCAAIVERDEKTAKVCAKSMNAPLVTPNEFMEMILRNECCDTVVVLSCVTDTMLWQCLAFINCGHLFASPPCQPWSGAGVQKGLQTQDGQVFSEVLKKAGQSRICTCTVENVSAIVKHSDFPILQAGAALDGMKLYIAGVFGVQRIAPVHRDRWLGTFVHVSFHLQSSLVQLAQVISFASQCFDLPLPGPTLSEAHAVFASMPSHDREELCISANALHSMERSDMVPKWMSQKVDWSKDHPILTARTLSGTDKMSGIMARYGSQHELPENLLLSRGLQTMILQDNDGHRYFSPWEIAAALGFPEGLVLSKELDMAFQQTGNAISIFHAALQIYRVHVMLDDQSPFTCGNPNDIVKQIACDAIKLIDVKQCFHDEFRSLVPCPPVIDLDAQAAKRQKVDVTATVPFVAVETRAGDMSVVLEPTFSVESMFGKSQVHPFCMGGIATIKHANKHWMTTVHCAKTETIASLITRAMPHAKSQHFASFSIGGQAVSWTDFVQCIPTCNIDFVPNELIMTCVSDFTEPIMLKSDVTWTIDTARAALAGQLNCNINSLAVKHQGLPAASDEFIVDFQSMEFQVHFRTIVPGYMLPVKDETLAKDPGMVPRSNMSMRLVARHPVMKSTKTVCVPDNASFAVAVRTLFPDVSETTPWQVYVDGCEVDPATLIQRTTMFTVEWKGYRPLAPCDVQLCSFQWPIENSAEQVANTKAPERWVKSPFATKAKILRLDESTMLMQIASSFVAHTMMNTNITCQVGGSIIDPVLPVGQIPVEAVITFKIAPRWWSQTSCA